MKVDSGFIAPESTHKLILDETTIYELYVSSALSVFQFVVA